MLVYLCLSAVKGDVQHSQSRTELRRKEAVLMRNLFSEPDASCREGVGARLATCRVPLIEMRSERLNVARNWFVFISCRKATMKEQSEACVEMRVVGGQLVFLVLIYFLCVV